MATPNQTENNNNTQQIQQSPRPDLPPPIHLDTVISHKTANKKNVMEALEDDLQSLQIKHVNLRNVPNSANQQQQIDELTSLIKSKQNEINALRNQYNEPFTIILPELMDFGWDTLKLPMSTVSNQVMLIILLISYRFLLFLKYYCMLIENILVINRQNLFQD